MDLKDLAGGLLDKVTGGNEAEEQDSGVMGMAEKGLGALGVTKDAVIGKGAEMLGSATGLDVGGMLGKFGLGGGDSDDAAQTESPDTEAE